MLVAANFHYVRERFDEPYPAIHGVTPSEFSSQLAALRGCGDFVDAKRIAAAVRGDAALPGRAIVVTFDDGLREQFEVARPILRQMGIPAIFYVNTAPIQDGTVETVHKLHLLRARVEPSRLWENLLSLLRDGGIEADVASVDPVRAREQYRYDSQEIARMKYLFNFVLGPNDVRATVDRAFDTLLGLDEAALSHELYMDRDQLRTLADEGALGSHSHRHLPLGRIGKTDSVADVARSMRLLHEWTGHRIQTFSFPYGSRDACSTVAAEAAQQGGAVFGFTMERAMNNDLHTPMFLARCANNDLPGAPSAQWSANDLHMSMPSATWFREATA